MKLRCPKSILIPIAFLMGWSGIAQSEAPSHGGLDQESYREDQFYIGLNYNVRVMSPQRLPSEAFLEA